jgi:hypothetical protein
MSEILHQERRPDTALEPTAAPLLHSTFAGVRTRAVRFPPSSLAAVAELRFLRPGAQGS